MKKSIAAIAAVLAVSFALGACNTMRGMGKDVERAGEKVQSATNK